MESKNMLTTKEATLIADLLTMEESACKKRQHNLLRQYER